MAKLTQALPGPQTKSPSQQWKWIRAFLLRFYNHGRTSHRWGLPCKSDFIAGCKSCLSGLISKTTISSKGETTGAWAVPMRASETGAAPLCTEHVSRTTEHNRRLTASRRTTFYFQFKKTTTHKPKAVGSLQSSSPSASRMTDGKSHQLQGSVSDRCQETPPFGVTDGPFSN